MQRALRRFVRAGAFVSKEIAEVRRQPRLVLSLILGPFLILLLFGIGYQGEKGKLSAIIVIPNSDGYSQNVQDYNKLVSGQINIVEVTKDGSAALDRLRRRDVDIVVTVPKDAARQIAAGSQAKLLVAFNEVDPLRRDYVTYLSYLFTNEINKQTLAAVASQGQASAGDFRSINRRLRNSLAEVESKLDRGDMGGADQSVRSMQGASADAQLAVLLAAQLLSSDTPLIKPEQHADSSNVSLERGQDVTARLNSDVRAVSDELESPNPDRPRAKERVSRVRADLDDMDKLTQQFQDINPLVLAAPFYAIAQNTAPIPVGFTSYYAPGVLVLLIQHIAVTLAALSILRERLLGTIELFRVSPVSPSEILAGKYISFMVLLGIVSAVLLGLTSNELTVGGVRLSLGVPILGDWALLVVTIALVIFASVGLGFLIATVSKSESQAVQLAMLVLLTSVFFSGFFLRVETFWEPVRFVSYALPVTYGIASLQVIMLRGGVPGPVLLVALLMLGAFFGLLGFVLFNREFRRG